MAERPAVPDYSLEEVQELRSETELRAVADKTRRRILSLLRSRAASTTELAEALGQPKGTVGHHLKVLEDAKLIRVVRTRKVRALTEKYYGRHARLYRIVADEGAHTLASEMLRQVADEVAPAEEASNSLAVVHARVAPEHAAAFAQRVHEIASDFQALDDEDEEVVFGLVAGVYRTEFGALPKKKGRKRA